MSPKNAIVLFGHGARDPEWAQPMARTRDRLCAMAPGLRVELAFLEFMRPGLGETIDALVAEGVGHIAVVPMFIAQGGHLKSDLPNLIAAACERHPACAIEQVAAVGEAETVIAAMAAYALACGTPAPD